MNHNEKDIKKSKTPWPTKKVMEQVYDNKLWGDGNSLFYSGDGSHNPKLTYPYIKAVTKFLKSFKRPLVLCDLGCGDFNIGKELVPYTNRYIAVDIVSDLITYNEAMFKAENLEFQCLDISVDDLPEGECVILRQVLQHLSNAEVHRVLRKLVCFKFVVLTEHIPNGDFISNKDIISGQGIRLKKQSGLDILAAPFNFKIEKQNTLSTVIVDNNKGVIRTTLYQLF